MTSCFPSQVLLQPSSKQCRSAPCLLPTASSPPPAPTQHLQLPPPLPVPRVKVAPLPAPSSTAWLVNVHPAAQLDGSMLGTDTDIKALKFKPDPVGFVWTQLFSDTYRLAKVGGWWFFFFSSYFATWSNEKMEPWEKGKGSLTESQAPSLGSGHSRLLTRWAGATPNMWEIFFA